MSGQDLQLAINGGFAPRFWPGVNLGVTVPGHAPGELAPTRARLRPLARRDAATWASASCASTRSCAPRFYEALAALQPPPPEAPLYFIQGVWIPEEEFLATQERVRGHGPEFDARDRRRGRGRPRRRDAARARPGHAGGALPHRRRRAGCWPGRPASSGTRTRSRSTDRRNAGARRLRGPLHRSRRRARRRWRAGSPRGSTTSRRSRRERGWSRPLTFTNWLTVDPLGHPLGAARATRTASPSTRCTCARPPRGRAASSPPTTRIRTTPTSCGCEYQRTAHADRPVRRLPARSCARTTRGQAVMITEFGVPSGLGAAHRGPLGRDQGDHSEQEAGRIDAAMLREIERQGYAGGAAVRVDRRVVQAHLEHAGHRAARRPPPAVAQRADQRGAVRRRRRRARRKRASSRSTGAPRVGRRADQARRRVPLPAGTRARARSRSTSGPAAAPTCA